MRKRVDNSLVSAFESVSCQHASRTFSCQQRWQQFGEVRFGMSESWITELFLVCSQTLAWCFEPSNPSSKPELKIFDETTGALLSTLELDSEKFVPYAAEQFRHLSRERFSLEVSKGQWSVGWLLDMWRFHSFDTVTNSLYLSIYRPAGISKRGFGGEVVPVQEVHAKFNLSFDS